MNINLVLENLSFLADYSHFILIALALVVVVMFVYSVGTRNQMIEMSSDLAKTVKNLDLTISENDTEVRKAIAPLKAIVSSLNKQSTDHVNELKKLIETNEEDEKKKLAAIQETVKESVKEEKDIHALFEQQGVFLHDQFEALRANKPDSSATDGALAEIKASLAQLQEDVAAANSSGVIVQQQGMQQSAQQPDGQAQAQATQSQEPSALISDALNRLAGQMDAKLELIADKVGHRFNNSISGTMQSFHSLQNQIEKLLVARDEIETLGRDVSSLSHIMLGRGGNISGTELSKMLSVMLPEDSYTLNPVIGGVSVAAKVSLPGEQDALVIDDKLPMKDYENLYSGNAGGHERLEARERISAQLMRHIDSIADSFLMMRSGAIGNALLFVQSETAFAEIQAHHRECIEHAYRRKVWLVSPTTLAAILNMARSAIKDHRARQQLEQMRASLENVMQESQAFQTRLIEIGDHVNNAMRSVQRAETAGVKLFSEVQTAAHLSDTPAITQDGGNAKTDGIR